MISALSLAAAVSSSAYTPVAQALNFGNMWNPSRWMGGGHNDYYDDGLYGSPWGGGYGDPYGGYGGYEGYGGGPWGAPYGAPGYGAGYPGIGYGAPGYFGAPAAGISPLPSASAPSTAGSKAEIDALKRRIEELESARQPGNLAPAPDRQPAPAFRPMDKY